MPNNENNWSNDLPKLNSENKQNTGKFFNTPSSDTTSKEVSNDTSNFVSLPKTPSSSSSTPSSSPLNSTTNISSNTSNNLPSNPSSTNKPVIEIPQAYYDKLEKERLEKEQKEAAELQNKQERKEIHHENSKMLSLVLLNALLLFASLYLTIKVNEIAFFIFPVASIILTIFNALKDQKESSYPTSILLGGMGLAVISYAISAIDSNNVDYWTYYAIASAVLGFIFFAISNIITKIITNRQDIKALATIGYLIFFAAIIGIPYYLYTKYPDEFYRYVFNRQAPVVAETESEYVLKTLKNRYNISFTCDSDVQSKLYSGTQVEKIYTCYAGSNTKDKISVTSMQYYDSDNEDHYIVKDDYMDILKLNNARQTISQDILDYVAASEVTTYLYPESGCRFIGDCAECDEYYETYQSDEEFVNQYNFSKNLNLSKYLSMDTTSFINEYKFKLIINISISSNLYYDESNYDNVIDKTLTILNNIGLKNTYGYYIRIYSYDKTNDLKKEVYKVKGDKSSDGTFKDPITIE